MSINRKVSAAAMALTATLASLGATAQQQQGTEESGGLLAEIVVTAQRR